METLYMIYIFIFGTVLGSFYNVVGYRLPKGESLVNPPSHCPNCNHKLRPIELIPIISYIIQRAKCKNCGKKISPFYASFEVLTGILFVISYMVFGFSSLFWISLVFVSSLIIISVSDFNFMVIPDEILIVGIGLIMILKYFFFGFDSIINSTISAVVAFSTMYLIKLLGDFLFKKESLGGGDIKLMLLFGVVLPLPVSIVPIFIGAFIALPISIFQLLVKKDHMLPFGPYLGIGALILFFYEVTAFDIYQFLLNLY